MQFNIKQFMSVMGLFCCASSLAGQYYVTPIARKEDYIKANFINQSTALVAARTKVLLSEEFKNFLNTDKNMQKIKKINLEGTTDTTLEVTDLEEIITESLLQKERELIQARDACFPKQVGYGVFTAAGVVTGVVFAGHAKGGKNVPATTAVGAGAFSAIVGSILFLGMRGEKDRLEKHIAQVQEMKKDWENFFALA